MRIMVLSFALAAFAAFGLASPAVSACMKHTVTAQTPAPDSLVDGSGAAPVTPVPGTTKTGS